ncbi:MAG: PaaI family thioesterase [Solirubrobacteraceae bacterium]
MSAGSPWGSGTLPEPLLALERSFEGFLGLEWVALSTEHAEVSFAVRDNLRQPLGLLHGGIYSAVAETIASVATGAAVWRDGMTVSGLSNAAHFLRPVTEGTVHVAAACRGHDEREWLWSHEFTDDRERLCALVDVRIAVRPRPRPA